MRLTSLLALLLLASLAWAQEAPSAPPPPPQESAEPAPTPPPAEAAPPPPGAQPAPQLGHPLDPADVATLTGRSGERQTAYQAGYGYYYPYAASLPLFGNGRFPGSNWATGMFGPIGFGRGTLFLFRNGGFAPPLFGSAFVGHSRHGGGHHR